jgi:hypothetical protein
MAVALGDTAFKCEPYQLFRSAQCLYIEARTADDGVAVEFMDHADRYEAFAFDLIEIRALPETA